MLMENFLQSKEYWTIVEAGVLKPTADDAQRAEIEKEKLKDLKAKNYLFKAIDRAILETILNKSTSKTIWDSMKKKYQGNERAKWTMAIANKMRIHGENLEDVAIVEKILRSMATTMATKFNYVVCSIEESNDIEALSLDELQNLLLVHERKINRQDKQEQAIIDPNLQARQMLSASNVECFQCHKYGHYCFKCRANLNRGESSNFAEYNKKNDDASLFMVCHPKEVSKKNVCQGKGKDHKSVMFIDHIEGHSMVMALLIWTSILWWVEGLVDEEDAAYTPQQNGVCERRNHTIMNMVRSLMSKSNLPKEFWPKAVNWSVHILHRSPTSPLPNMTPKKAWSGHKPAVNNFRIFGCIAYAHVPNQKRANLKALRKVEEESLPTAEHSIGGSLPTTPELESGTGSRHQRKKRRLAWLEDYETKLKENGEVDKFKARLVAKGYKQKFSINYQEVFAPVARMDTIRLVIALASQNSWLIYQLDVKSAFLHGDLQEQIFVDQPPSYVKPGFEHKEVLDRFPMKNCNSVTTPVDKGVKLIKDLGGRSVDSKLYKQIVGSLMYLTTTRPNIMHGVSLTSRCMEHPKELHLQSTKRILRYLRGTTNFGLFYKKGD
ncbi:hypothetical protein SLEP1_g29599 [Rubroshorea leprosula]|uniref:Reverse transcriptase Ty1/copia-type domain-containing protein n=1 Tax=Rubroshorea leprosula TaxID=152421 RepID=A0AAV5K6C8_9ROSI|nr:hypothetical protein SLEP1_g29599 [Rubroshorea leprosula]